jgi:recombination protein RecR
MYSKSIQNLIRSLKHLPSVGERTAERYVFHLLKSGKKEVTQLMLALKELIENVKSCEGCWNFSDTSPCSVCSDAKRDHTTVCIVLDPQDLVVIEKSGAYHGLYHVLRGLVDPGDPESIKHSKIAELIIRIKNQELGIKEVLLALNPDIAGETTMLYLDKELKNARPDVSVTRLARGLPMGSDIRYADEITLGSAIKNRIKR